MATDSKATDQPPIPPAQMQRAVFIVVLSFLFFLAMMAMFYVRQSLLYFLLASAFLIIYIVTMISFVRLRRGASSSDQK
jgi:hypothetical protein